jgi:hypothetical protein
MARDLLVAQFHDYGAAHRALCELIQAGILSNRISIVAGDRSNSQGATRDFGILAEDAESYITAVRRGTTLLAVAAAGSEQARVAEMIERHAPFDLAEPGSDRVHGRAADGRRGWARRDVHP